MPASNYLQGRHSTMRFHFNTPQPCQPSISFLIECCEHQEIRCTFFPLLCHTKKCCIVRWGISQGRSNKSVKCLKLLKFFLPPPTSRASQWHPTGGIIIFTSDLDESLLSQVFYPILWLIAPDKLKPAWVTFLKATNIYSKNHTCL